MGSDRARHHYARVAASNFIAAGAATFTSRLVLYPLDTLRTRAQTALTASSSSLISSTNSVVSRQPSLFAASRFRSLWAGFLTSCVGAIPAQSLYYTAYSALRGAFGVAPAAAAANVVAAFVRVPTEMLKQRTQCGVSRSTLSAAISVLQTDGVFGLWRGFVPQVFRDVPYAVALFAVYETLKGKSHKKSLLNGAIAGAAASLATAPLDLIKTRAMTSTGREASMFSIFKQVLQSEGYLTFWRGTTHRVLHKVCSSALFFASLEMYKRLLNVADPPSKAHIPGVHRQQHARSVKNGKSR